MPAIYTEASLVSTTATTSGTSNSVNVSRADLLLLSFAVSAISGTAPQIGFSVDFSNDQSEWWLAKDILRTGSAAALLVRLPVFGKYVRIRYHIFGTSPSVTFAASLSKREG